MVWPFGGKKKKEESPSASPESSSEVVAPKSGEQLQDIGSFRTPADMLNDPSLNTPSTPGAAPPGPATPGYNPYEGLPTTLDPGMLSKLYNLPDSPEYLFQEEARVKRRSWSENLTFYTGVGYFGGSLLGGGYGAMAALSVPPQIANETSKLKMNRILNGATNRGTFFGNNIGVLGLLYAGTDSVISYMRDKNESDLLNSAAAGVSTGMLYKMMSGPRAMAVYGSAGGVLALTGSAVVAMLA